MLILRKGKLEKYWINRTIIVIYELHHFEKIILIFSSYIPMWFLTVQSFFLHWFCKCCFFDMTMADLVVFRLPPTNTPFGNFVYHWSQTSLTFSTIFEAVMRELSGVVNLFLTHFHLLPATNAFSHPFLLLFKTLRTPKQLKSMTGLSGKV